MKNSIKKVLLTTFSVLIFILMGHTSHAQEIPKAENSIHDKMYDLIKKSESVVLPAEVLERINKLNADNPKKAKTVHTQTTVFKVLHNKALSNADILFFGNQILKSQSASIIVINADIQKLLNQ